jgi:hypothetical protein
MCAGSGREGEIRLQTEQLGVPVAGRRQVVGVEADGGGSDRPEPAASADQLGNGFRRSSRADRVDGPERLDAFMLDTGR